MSELHLVYANVPHFPGFHEKFGSQIEERIQSMPGDDQVFLQRKLQNCCLIIALYVPLGW